MGKKNARRKPKEDMYHLDLIQKSDMHNERFESYYKAQNIVPDEEWDVMMEALRRVLPTTFRVAGSRQTVHELNRTIQENYVPLLGDTVFEGVSMPAPAQIPWYPDGLAWQFNVPKKVIRKLPEFKKFHSFLVFETEVGNISRQEAVSMVPPLFLDVEPHHQVIDMCAAPGSKTAQLLEALHAHDTATSTSVPPGLLIANDSDHKRTHLLIHQSARLPSPALMVTNLDASIYPIIKIPGGSVESKAGKQEGKGKKREEMLLFDRILCDVPCSGDGTMRKNPGIWKSWGPMDGNGLHGLQLRILQRAIRMLKTNGRIVYSTCSLNPVENEAVIAAALQSNPDFELLDVSSRLPTLVRRPGLTTWRPTADKAVSKTFGTYHEFAESLRDREGTGSKMTEGHWPPPNTGKLNLERCLRIYPHLQDTGGFFVAVLQRKKGDGVTTVERKREVDEVDDVGVPGSKKPRLEGDVDVDDVDEMPDCAENSPVRELVQPLPSKPARYDKRKGKGKVKAGVMDTGGSFKENPYTFLPPDDPILLSCIERLNLSPSFPSSNVLVRNPSGEAVRSLYLTNDLVKSIVQYNDYNRLRLTACGTKVFAKQEAGKGTEAQFRTLGEGLPVVLPFMRPESVMDAPIAALKTLVEAYYPLCAAFADPFRGQLEARASGSHVVRFPAGESCGVILTHDIILPLWKSNVSVTLMIDKKAKSALSQRVYGEDITTAGREAAGRKGVDAATPIQSAPAADMGLNDVQQTSNMDPDSDV